MVMANPMYVHCIRMLLATDTFAFFMSSHQITGFRHTQTHAHTRTHTTGLSIAMYLCLHTRQGCIYST